MISKDQVRTIMGRDLHGQDDKIGKIGQVYLDDQTGEPAWVTVSTGLFGGRESFVPLQDAQLQGEDVRVPYDKERIKGAPSVDVDGHLSPEEESNLYEYYGLGTGVSTGTESGHDRDVTTTTGTMGHTGQAEHAGHAGHREGDRHEDHDEGRGVVGRDTSGPTTDDAMTRSEERLHVGTEKVQTGRARLRKYIETETEQVTVPVSKERVTVTTEPITDANRGNAMSGAELSEEEHEVTLTEERPLVSKETVPVERVRLDKEVETTQETVSADVRKERIVTEGGEEHASGHGTRSGGGRLDRDDDGRLDKDDVTGRDRDTHR